MSIDTSKYVELFCADFLNVHSYVVDGMEKDLIFPQFCRQNGQTKIQGFEVLDVFSLMKYSSIKELHGPGKGKRHMTLKQAGDGKFKEIHKINFYVVGLIEGIVDVFPGQFGFKNRTLLCCENIA